MGPGGEGRCLERLLVASLQQHRVCSTSKSDSSGGYPNRSDIVTDVIEQRITAARSDSSRP